MNYSQYRNIGTPVKVGLIGTGAFGNSFLFQIRATPLLEIAVVCDRKAEIARQACLNAGFAEAQLTVCSSTDKAQSAIEAGKIAIVEDAALLMPLPFDIVVESTGIPQAGAQHGRAALEHGKHVVMVNKETDSVVGPILSKLAQEAGLVYTQTDGDQPSLLIGLIDWAETIGLPVVCGGKASVPDFIYHSAERTIKNGGYTIQLPPEQPWTLWDMAEAGAAEIVAQRRQSLNEIPQILVPDLCEMAVVMNASGYGFDTPTLHAPIVRISEMADIFSGQAVGGILQNEGVIDVVHCLRQPTEAGLAGGVFIVVACEDKATWQLLAGKGQILNRQQNRALIYRPYHLLGIETATSILAAVVMKQATGGTNHRPQVDLCAKTTAPLKAGQRLGMIKDHAIPGLAPLLLQASASGPDTPIPFYIAAENNLTCDVPAGTILTHSMVNYNSDAALWQLKQQQDAAFFP